MYIYKRCCCASQCISKYLHNTVRRVVLLDSLAPIRFSNTQEYLPESSRCTDLITKDCFSRVAPSYLVRFVKSKICPFRYLAKKIQMFIQKNICICTYIKNIKADAGKWWKICSQITMWHFTFRLCSQKYKHFAPLQIKCFVFCLYIIILKNTSGLNLLQQITLCSKISRKTKKT